jgi:hypothetical protein
MIKETLDLWKYLKSNGGLDIKNYDYSIIEELQRELSLPIGKDFDKQLKDEDITIENFIIAFFKVVEPFSEMMSDLLLMFEKAGAKTTNNNLDIEFDFDNAKSDLKFDLENFRKWINVWRSVKNKYNANLWDTKSIWSLSRIFGDRNYRSQNRELKKWLLEYYEMKLWPDFLINLPKCSNPYLSQLINRAWNLWLTIIKESAKLTKDRKILHEKYLHNREIHEQNENKYSWNPSLLAQIDHDCWSGSFAERVFSTIEELENLDPISKQEYSSHLVKDLENIFSEIPTIELEEDIIVNDLKDFLSLPIWQKRYELYSVWVSSQIIESLKDNSYRVHTYNERILFSFSGTHLATFDNFSPRLHIWSELRSPLENPVGKGRTKAIQPDYSLITDPVTNFETSILVIECKQYKTPSKKNFVNALTDYANGRINSNVILVNYGKINDEILKEIPIELRNRTFLIGNMRPMSSESISRFKEIVRETITNHFGYCGEQNKITLNTSGTVCLKWAEFPRDLDLHLFIEADNAWDKIFYSSKGDSISYPWATLDNDIQNGFGPENVKISKWIKRKYHFAVHNYSGESELKLSNASVEFKCGEQIYTFKCPNLGNGKWWDVFYIDVQNNKIIKKNIIIENIENE